MAFWQLFGNTCSKSLYQKVGSFLHGRIRVPPHETTTQRQQRTASEWLGSEAVRLWNESLVVLDIALDVISHVSCLIHYCIDVDRHWAGAINAVAEAKEHADDHQPQRGAPDKNADDDK